MANKKATVEKLKEELKSNAKQITLTNKQLDDLRDLATDIMDIRRTLQDLEGEDNISTIMFKVGSIYSKAENAESVIDQLISDIDEEDNNW